jgi:cystathionine beta-lyase/cystathionine gamma-synthase
VWSEILSPVEACFLSPDGSVRVMNDEQMRVAGIAPNAVRLSVGVEGAEDLQADLAQALAAL